MTKIEYFDFSLKFFQKCIDISKKKNADYTGGDDNPFSNFTSVGEDWAEIGFFTRMMDKMQRIKSFIKKGKLEVEDESVLDTLRDLANYSCLLAGYIESKKVKTFPGSVTINNFPSGVNNGIQGEVGISATH